MLVNLALEPVWERDKKQIRNKELKYGTTQMNVQC